MITVEQAIDGIKRIKIGFFNALIDRQPIGPFLDAAITALEAQKDDMWIPISSGKLPELGINVKVTWRTHDIFEHTNEDETEIAYRSINYPYDWTLSRSNQRINVIAWKPLDEPWKEEQS